MGRPDPQIGRDRRTVTAELGVERTVVGIDDATTVIGVEGLPIGVADFGFGDIVGGMMPVASDLKAVAMMTDPVAALKSVTA
jgi:hypothetical protein